MKKVTKLTPRLLRKMVLEEKRKLQKEVLEQQKEKSEDVKAEEIEADGYASALEKDIDHLKVLKIKETKLKKELLKIHEAKKVLKKNISKKL